MLTSALRATGEPSGVDDMNLIYGEKERERERADPGGGVGRLMDPHLSPAVQRASTGRSRPRPNDVCV